MNDIRFLKACLLGLAYVLVLVWPVVLLGALLARVVCWWMGIEVE